MAEYPLLGDLIRTHAPSSCVVQTLMCAMASRKSSPRSEKLLHMAFVGCIGREAGPAPGLFAQL